MATSPLTSLAVNSDGALAYGTAGGGASLLANGQWQTLAAANNFPAANRIYALATDGGGYLWVASSGGVQQANPGAPENAIAHGAAEGMAANSVRTIFADSAGTIWLGGIGAAHFDGATWTNYGAK